MLAPVNGSPFDLEAELTRLERDYASVVALEGRLHDEPQEFLLAYLREPITRQGDPLRGLLTRAEDSLTHRLTRLEIDLHLLEERCLDEDWRKLTLLLAEILFWQEEERAWKFFLPRFVDSLVYNNDLRRALLKTASLWEKNLSSRGKRRLNALQDSKKQEELVKELNRVEGTTGYFKGEYENERRAILAWLRGMVFLSQDHLTEALRELETAERDLPKNGEVLHEKLADAFNELGGKLLWEKGSSSAVHHPDAVRVLQKVTVWLPQKQIAWYWLGTAFALAVKFEEAIQTFQKAIALNEKDAYSWNGVGNVYYRMNKYEDAIESYQKAIKLDEKYQTPWNGLGYVYHSKGEDEKAIQAHQKAIALNEKDATSWNGLGNAYYGKGEHEKALQAYRKAITLDDKFTYAWNNLGNAYSSMGEHEKAIRAYQKVIKLPNSFGTPTNAHTLAWNGLGNIYSDRDKHVDAIQAYQNAITLDEKHAPTWNGLGSVYDDIGKLEEAIKAYQKAIASDEKYAAPWNSLGRIYYQMGKYDEVIKACQNAIALDEKHSHSWNMLGNMYILQDNFEEAMPSLRRAVELKPEYGPYRTSLIGVLHRLNRKAEAQAEMERARPLMEKEDEYNRACFATICGETEEALRLLEVALQKGEISKDWARQDPDFESIREHPKFKELTA
jgi:tetratricopeptide (TPR) repeat protein